MVGGISYEEVLRRRLGYLPITNIREITLRYMLEEISKDSWELCFVRTPYPRVIEFPFQDLKAAVVIKGPDGNRHYIAVENLQVHDPSFDSPFAMNKYPNRDWRIQALIKSCHRPLPYCPECRFLPTTANTNPKQALNRHLRRRRKR